MKNVSFLILALISFILFSCKDDNEVSPSNFAEISDIATFHGNINSDIVIINTQGGPETNLDDESVKEIMKFTETTDLLYVNVHQAQTKTPSQFLDSDISFEEAKIHSKQSVRYLEETVSYFKAKNKTVYVLGVSFGAFVTQELIADYGVNVADGYLIMVGRLDIDAETWVPFSEGKYTSYKYGSDGTYQINELKHDFNVEERNMARLAAGLGFNRFTEKLVNNSDLSKVIYVYGDRDEEVGPLSEKEIQFLKDRGTQVILSENSGHGDAIFTGMEILKSIFEN